MPNFFLISRWYLLAPLAAALFLSPLPYSLVAFVALLLVVYVLLARPRPGRALAYILVAALLTPLALQPWLAPGLLALLALPALPLLHHTLKENAISQHRLPFHQGRHLTPTARSLAAALLAVLLVSLLVRNAVLLWTGVLMGLYFAALVSYVFLDLGRTPVTVSRTWLRVVAGSRGRALFSLRKQGRLPLRLSLQVPYPWARLHPAELVLERAEAQVSLTVTPPLAGPGRLLVQARAVDPWGLVQGDCTLEPGELLVIPRARFAEWLARKYLERAVPGAATSFRATVAGETGRMSGRGVEYTGSRLYQPGDRMKDIDWRHTYRIQKLVTKEFAESPGQVAVISLNLEAEDPEAADVLAHSLISSALTFAIQGIPFALAGYTSRAVAVTTPLIHPRESLKGALKLAQRITLAPPAERFLQPAQLWLLRREIARLQSLESEPAQKLWRILELEKGELQEAARTHPLTLAVETVARQIQPPAFILLITLCRYDREALQVMQERLGKRGYVFETVEGTLGATGSLRVAWPSGREAALVSIAGPDTPLT